MHGRTQQQHGGEIAGRDAGSAVSTRAAVNRGRSAANEVEERIRREIGSDAYERYLGRSARLELGADGLCVTVPSRFAADMIDARFGPVLRRAVEGISPGGPGGASTVRFEVSAREAGVAPEVPAPSSLRRGGVERGPRRRAPQQTLSDFVVGPCNRLAFEAARRVAESADGGGDCPCFVYGPSGVGKSHLLSAIAARFAEVHPGARTKVVTAESFTNEYIAAVRSNTIEAFHRAYRRIELLCIDDVHFLTRKTGTQTELLHTFDALDLSGARVVLASDAHPRHIREFSDALVSRFLSGSLARIEPPGPVTRRRLVQHFASRAGLVLGESEVASLAEGAALGPGGVRASARDLLGLVNRLRAHAAVAGSGAVDAATVAAVLREQAGAAGRGVESAPERPVQIDRVIECVCAALGVSREDLGGPGRHKGVVLARAMVTLLAKRLTTRSFPEISSAMGLRSHSTVISAHRRIEAQMAEGVSVGAGLSIDGMPIASLADHLEQSLRRGG